jgi:hypothetical protein
MEGSPDSLLVAVWVTVIVGGVLALIGGWFYWGSRIDRARDGPPGRQAAESRLNQVSEISAVFAWTRPLGPQGTRGWTPGTLPAAFTPTPALNVR